MVISLVFSNPEIQTVASRYAAAWLSQKIGTEVQIGKINLSYRGAFLLKDLAIKDEHDEDMLKVSRLEFFISGVKRKNREINLSLLSLKDFDFVLMKHTEDEMSNLAYFLQHFESKVVDDSIVSTERRPWVISCRSVKISDGFFKYQNEELITEGYTGIDFVNIGLEINEIDLSNLKINKDTITAAIKNIAFKEKSGFEVKSFQGALTFSPVLLEINQMLAETNKSLLNVDIRFDYESMADFNDFIPKVQMTAYFRPSTLDLSDIGYFSPVMFSMTNVIDFKGDVSGTVASLKAERFEFSYGKNTSFYGDIQLVGLPLIDTTAFRANIQRLTTDVADLRSFHLPLDAGKIEIPAIINKAGKITASGTWVGTYNNFISRLEITSRLGYIRTDLTVNQPDTQSIVSYKGKLIARNFNVGRLIDQEKAIGKTTFDLDLKGSGLRVENFDFTTIGNVKSLDIRGYNYENIKIDGRFREKQFEGYLAMKDDNLDFIFNGLIDFDQDQPVFNFSSDVHRADLFRLKLSGRDSTSLLATHLDINFKGAKLDEISGMIRVENTTYQEGDKSYLLDNLVISTNTSGDGIRSLEIDSDLVEAGFAGNFNFSELPLIFDKYLAAYSNVLPGDLSKKNGNGSTHVIDFWVDISNAEPLTELFLPQLQLSTPAKLTGYFHAEDQKLDLEFCADYIDFQSVRFVDGRIATSSDINNFYLDATASKVYFSNPDKDLPDGIGVDSLKLVTLFRADSLFYDLTWNDLTSLKLNAGDISGTMVIEEINLFKNHLNEFDLLIDGQSWNIVSENELLIAPGSLQFNNMGFYNNRSKLEIEGIISASETDSLKLHFKEINISNADKLLGVAQLDIDGILTGDATLTGLYGRPNFLVDIFLDSLALNKEPLGLLSLDTQWNDTDQSLYVILDIIKRGNKATSTVLSLTGDYFPMRNDRNFDFDVTLSNLGLHVLNPFIVDFADINQGGYTSGKLRIGGTYAKPVMLGKLNILRTQFLVKYLNTLYSIVGTVDVGENIFNFNSLTLNDTKGRSASVNGSITHNYFYDFFVDLSVNHDNFKVMSTTSKDNELFYGNAYSSGVFTMKGNFDDLTMEITARSERGTQIKIPISTDVSVSENNFVIFKSAEDKSDMGDKVYDINLKGLEINLTLDVTEDAEIELFLPYSIGTIEGTGKGELGIGVNKRGDLSIFGDYLITKGEFVFNFEGLISKKFQIKDGSRLSWRGDPYDGTIDVRGVYKTRTSLNGLQLQVDSSSLYRTNVDVLCIINLQNDLYNPDISFSIDFVNVPDNTKEIIYASLDTTDQGEMSQQILSLLLLNSFSYTSNNPDISATSFKLLSSQVSNLLSGISKDFNIGIKYQPGTEITQEEIEVALSTQLFNDRLIIDGNFGVRGKASEQNATSVLGDINMEYKITDDGRFRVRAFNRTNNLSIIENNAPYTQGVGIFYRREFDRLINLFRSAERKGKSKNNDSKEANHEAVIESARKNED